MKLSNVSEKGLEKPKVSKEKNYGNYILYGLLVLVVIVLVFSFTGFSPKIRGTATTSDEKAKPGFRSIDSGSTGTGDVSIELTPIGISNNQLKVGISANTHSVSLDQFDLKEITTLEYNEKSIKPTSAPNLGSHHSNGELVFEVEEEISSFTIKIKGIPKVEERIFKWL